MKLNKKWNAALNDIRFSNYITNPLFRPIPQNVKKIKVDNRFK